MTEAMIRKKLGMASLKHKVLQDGPPPVRFARRISNKGLSAMAIYLAAFGAFSWGMYRVGQRINTRRALEEENFAAPCSILPDLEAGENERFFTEWNKYTEHETEVMKDVSE